MSTWWSGRSGVERVDRFTRWPLYLTSASEPAVALLLVTSEPQVPTWGTKVLVLLVLIMVIHAVACVTLLRAGIRHLLGGRPPDRRLIGLAVVVTALGAGVTAIPAFGQARSSNADSGYLVGLALAMLFLGALTVAVTPLLSPSRLLAAVVIPALALGVLQNSAGLPDGPLWWMSYLVTVGLVAASYRLSVWFLAAVWEIDAARDVQARLAVAEERLRFARDLHDVLGRNLALIALNSELAAQLMRRGQEGALEHMVSVRQTAQDSMREVREVVGGYRSADLEAELAGARSVLRSAGISTRVIGDGASLPSTAQAALAWVVREATTNIIRHADPNSVRIELDLQHHKDSVPTAVLRIENDGVRSAGSSSGGGAGLVGLQERLARLGGDLTAHLLPGDRFALQASLPLDGTSPALSESAERVP